MTARAGENGPEGSVWARPLSWNLGDRGACGHGNLISDVNQPQIRPLLLKENNCREPGMQPALPAWFHICHQSQVWGTYCYMGLSPALSTKQYAEQQGREIPRACIDCHVKGLGVAFWAEEEILLQAQEDTAGTPLLPWAPSRGLCISLLASRNTWSQTAGLLTSFVGDSWALGIGVPLCTCAYNSKCWRVWISCPPPWKRHKSVNFHLPWPSLPGSGCVSSLCKSLDFIPSFGLLLYPVFPYWPACGHFLNCSLVCEL